MSKFFVLYVRQYDFTEDSGKRVQGLKMTYLDEPVENTSMAKGRPPMTITSSDISLWSSFSSVPGYYDLEFTMRPDSKGKPTLGLRTARLLSDEKARSEGG
jgi:hypothetical protein